MTLVKSIDRITKWLDENVCGQISLKLPDDSRNGAEYSVEYVHPAAFPLYVPGKNLLPPSVPAPVPSVCVQLMEGSDGLPAGRRRLQIRLCPSCWNPGVHGGEVFYGKKDADAPAGRSYWRLAGEEAETYLRNMEGWRDSFNFADAVLGEIEGAEFIAGHRLVKEEGIRYGLFTEEGNIWDYYPYWHNWISFTLECGIPARVPEQYEGFL